MLGSQLLTCTSATQWIVHSLDWLCLLMHLFFVDCTDIRSLGKLYISCFQNIWKYWRGVNVSMLSGDILNSSTREEYVLIGGAFFAFLIRNSRTFLHFSSRHFHHWFHHYRYHLLTDFCYFYFLFSPLHLLLQHFQRSLHLALQQSLVEYRI